MVVAFLANRNLQNQYKAVLKRVKINSERAEQLNSRYLQGAASYTDVYIAQLNYMQVEQSEIALKADLLAGRVQLARALGGGWQTSDIEEADVEKTEGKQQ